MGSADLTELQSEIGTDKFDALTEEQTAIIYEKISRHELSKEQLAAIIKVAPTFVNGFVETVKVMANTAAGLSEAHKQAMEGLKIVESFVEPLNILAKDCETKEERIAIAGNIQNVVFKICDTTAGIQKEHNKAVQEFSNNLGILALALLAACLLSGLGGYALANRQGGASDTNSEA